MWIYVLCVCVCVCVCVRACVRACVYVCYILLCLAYVCMHSGVCVKPPPVSLVQGTTSMYVVELCWPHVTQ